MGNLQSRMGRDHLPMASRSEQMETQGNHIAQAIYSNRDDNPVQFVDVELGEVLKFEQSHTKLIAYTVPKCQLVDVDELKYIDEDAHKVKEALCMNGVIQEKECHLFKRELCTFKGIQEDFIKHADEASWATNTSETENEELLIFFFSGHGIVNDQDEFVGLVPMDYNDTGGLYITSENLLTWLQSSGCKANVLFIIDACHSGGFHKSSSQSEFIDLSRDSNARKVYVMYSCAPEKESFEHGILQHSIFSYCLTRAITANPPKTCSEFSRGLPIKDIEETYKCLTYAVCLLLGVEQQHPGLEKFLMEKKTPMRAKQADSSEPKPSLNQECLDWIKSCGAKDGSLDKLKIEGLLEKQEVVDIVLCIMMRCIVWYHMHVCYMDRITHPDVFPFAYKEVANTLREYTELECKEELANKEFEDCIKQHMEEIISKLSKRLKKEIVIP